MSRKRYILPEQIISMLREPQAEVVAEDLRARRMSIDAVPCFIVDGQYAISGAQEPEAFYPLLDLASFNKQAA